MLGENIKTKRKELELTLEEVGKAVGVSKQTIQRYESGVISNIPFDKIEALAKVLKTTPNKLINWKENTLEDRDLFSLEIRLKKIGYSIGYEEDAYLWINYPDGTLELTEADLSDIDKSIDLFLRFKLEEFKQNHIKDFRKK